MAEYINREATKAEVRKMFPSLVDRIKIIEVINSIPAADVVTWEELQKTWKIANHDVAPARHGRWVKARGSWCTPGGDPVWECSECGKGRHVYGIEHGTYGSDVADGQWVSCPNCGADMRGE